MIRPNRYINPLTFEFIIEIITIKNANKNGDTNANKDIESIKLKFIPRETYACSFSWDNSVI
jgi:hypothetical protein